MSERLTDEQWAEIQEKNPGIRLRRVLSPAGELVIRAPTSAEESTFQQMYFGSSLVPGACWRNLLVMIAVYPEPARMQAILKEWTGLAMNPRLIREMKLIRGEADDEEGKS